MSTVEQKLKAPGGMVCNVPFEVLDRPTRNIILIHLGQEAARHLRSTNYCWENRTLPSTNIQ
ncbi:unnamed protein product [Acanthoscelides obtectus]|uniref:Uncharacterized protein n=1 Tax=Acanthoscelides obtectus TaxID=200917 RepID=A0A9P0LXV1_ACAOB|nr:unnamed protein product [Acanthoscelides obtectus]CAK1631655.1 hypothetical protein AOBTE_LOCUS7076 [Acanthoscelides obtectus]